MSQVTPISRVQDIDIPSSVFNDQAEYIRFARKGLSGEILKQAVTLYGHRELFTKLLETSSTNLSRFYKRKALDEGQSEKILDTINLFLTAEKVFASFELANEWMNTHIPALGNERPIDLCDTFKGREIVSHALRKIEFGEFA